ncbi:hypothetical protein M622_18830, partial [Thauera terpenica 58Eu]
DPLDTPADMRTDPARRPLMAVASAGERLVAVGPRGLVIVSDDRGQSWSQANVPVQSDLLAVHFPTPQQGWAVGHEGVVLYSADGGSNWVKQLDGRSAAAHFPAHYAGMAPDPAAEAAAAQLELNYRGGPALPWLDVWFEDTRNGYAVGAFGMLMVTRDGGNTWAPWLERIENGEYLNLNAIRGIGNELFIVGERGRIYRLDRGAGRFVAIDTGYIGSFFGIVGEGRNLLAFGLRGVAYRSDDAGATWRQLAVPSEQTIAAGAAAHGSFVLGSVAGELLRGEWSGGPPVLRSPDQPVRMTGVAVLADGSLVLTGLDGVRIQAGGAAASGSK